MLNWLSAQTEYIVDKWSQSIKEYYPQHYSDWFDPENHLRALKDKWNLLDAVKKLDWDQILYKSDLKVLDLGCGAGWLSAFLSKYSQVKEIYSLDSDKKMLTAMLPEIFKGMGGDLKKDIPVLGYFEPILVEEGYFDLVVASSALHHSPDLDSLLTEIFKSLNKDGKLIIINETPWSNFSYFIFLIKEVVKLVIATLLKKTDDLPRLISTKGILYDPKLGDNMHSYYQWGRAISRAGFSYEIVNSGLFTQKHQAHQKNKLVHFICDKIKI